MLNQEDIFKRIYDQYQNMVLHTAYQYLQNQEWMVYSVNESLAQ